MVLLQRSGCTGRSPEFTFEEVCIIWDDDGLPTTHSCCSVHVSRQGAWLTSLCNVLATAETVSLALTVTATAPFTLSTTVMVWRQLSNTRCSAVMQATRAQ